MQREIDALEGQIQEIYSANAERECDESLEEKRTKDISLTPIDMLYEKLIEKLVDKFVHTAIQIQCEKGWFDRKDEDVSFFILTGLLELEKSEVDWTMYNITDTGKAVLKKAQLEIE